MPHLCSQRPAFERQVLRDDVDSMDIAYHSPFCWSTIILNSEFLRLEIRNFCFSVSKVPGLRHFFKVESIIICTYVHSCFMHVNTCALHANQVFDQIY